MPISTRSPFSIRIKKTLKVRDELRAKAVANGIALPTHESVTWTAVTTEEFEAKAAEVGILSEKNEDIRSLKELIIYGLKGLAAYAEHAYNLNFEKEEIFAFMERALAATTQDLSADELVGLTLETGKFGVDVMALLDQAKHNDLRKSGNDQSKHRRAQKSGDSHFRARPERYGGTAHPERRNRRGYLYPQRNVVGQLLSCIQKNTNTWPVTTEMPGGNKKKSSKASMVRSFSLPTVLFRQ